MPHAVLAVDDIDAVDVFGLGRAIRYHEVFSPAGTNVNFMQPLGDHTIAVRTYERGVEDETLACGTGSVASALVMGLKKRWASPVDVKTRSGAMLRISFDSREGRFVRVYLEGDARVIYQGTLWQEAWKRP